MAMNKNKVTKPLNLSEFDGWDLVPKADRDTVKEEVAEFVIDSILEAVGEARTPVSGGKYKASLSSSYKAVKGAQSSNLTANMELTGDMLDALTWENLGGNSLEVGWFDPTEAAKAHGHNTGAGPLPVRQSIPTAKQKFKKDITTGIAEIIAEFAEEPDDQDDETSDPVTPEISEATAGFGESFLSGVFGG